MVPKVNLVLTLICNDYVKKHPHINPLFEPSLEPGEECRLPEIQSQVATFKLALSLISGSLAAIISPKLGALSDRYGRLPMLAYVNAGHLVAEVITILAARFPNTVTYHWMLLSAMFDGL